MKACTRITVARVSMLGCTRCSAIHSASAARTRVSSSVWHDERADDPPARRRCAGAGHPFVAGRVADAARRAIPRVQPDAAAVAGALAERGAAARRRRDQACDGGRRRGGGTCRDRSACIGHRVHLIERRRAELPSVVRGARRCRPSDLADALHELGAQRRRGLLAHRGGEPRAVDQLVRLRRELCCRAASKRPLRCEPRTRRCCWLRATRRTRSH